jgi:hypothetical protein
MHLQISSPHYYSRNGGGLREASLRRVRIFFAYRRRLIILSIRRETRTRTSTLTRRTRQCRPRIRAPPARLLRLLHLAAHSAREPGDTYALVETVITHVLELGIRCSVRVCARGDAILKVGGVRLRDDIQRARGVLTLVLVVLMRRRGLGGLIAFVAVGLGEERRMLEGGEGGVEAAAERLGERAGVLRDGYACGGHGVEFRRE